MIDKILEQFPLKGMITQDILDTTSDKHRKEAVFCIGKKSLVEAIRATKIQLPKEFADKVFWGKEEGAIYLDGKHVITTQEGIIPMDIYEPREVTFILK